MEFDNACVGEYNSAQDKVNKYLANLKSIIEHTGELLEGNAFYIHHSFTLFPELFTKQVNLFWCGKQAKTKICEIGFNGGHSAMLMLLGRAPSPIDFTIFDICYHGYAKPCFNYIKHSFPHVNFEFVEGNSIEEMPRWIDKHPESKGTYDVIHVDGGHTEECIRHDMMNADQLVKLNGIIIVDDTNNFYINLYADIYLSYGKYVELDVLTTAGYPHRILQKIKD